MIKKTPSQVRVEIKDHKILYLCPKCRKTIQFKKKIYGNSVCMRCGQHLDWSPARDICIAVINTEDSDEAAWIAKEYYETSGLKEEDFIDIDEWRKTLRGEGAELYLLFKDQKGHGKFMRKYAKEGQIHDG